MRLHARPDHPDWHPEMHLAKVLFNGAPVQDILAADEARGRITQFTQTGTKVREGHVQICLPDQLGYLRASFIQRPLV